MEAMRRMKRSAIITVMSSTGVISEIAAANIQQTNLEDTGTRHKITPTSTSHLNYYILPSKIDGKAKYTF